MHQSGAGGLTGTRRLFVATRRSHVPPAPPHLLHLPLALLSLSADAVSDGGQVGTRPRLSRDAAAAALPARLSLSDQSESAEGPPPTLVRAVTHVAATLVLTSSWAPPGPLPRRVDH